MHQVRARRFIYDGDFKKAPASYKCPACSSPKSRRVGQEKEVGQLKVLCQCSSGSNH
jgi:hypothetical protein